MNIKMFNVIFLIIGVVMFSYFNSIRNPFIWDDITLIVDNPLIKNTNNFAKIFSLDLFHDSYQQGNYYRPIQTLTHMSDYAIWKLNPAGYHLSNILFHAISAILVYLLILQVSSNNTLSVLTSLLFSVSPIHTEAVTYISGRADSLVAIFFLLSLLFYIKHKTSIKTKLFYSISLASFILALLSKEIAIMLPPMIILYDIYFSKKTGLKEKIYSYLPYFSLLGFYVFLRTTILNFSHRPILNIQADFILRLISVFKSVVIYVLLPLFPFNLHMERALPIADSLWDFTVFTPIFLLFVIIPFTIKLSRSHKSVSFATAWFLINLIPVLSIFMPTKKIILAEHWLYLPSIGLFMTLGIGLDKLIKFKKGIAIAVIVTALLFYSYLTIRQNATWKDPELFYKRIISFSPDSSKAHFNLGIIYEQKNEFDKAIEEYKRAQEINPGYFLVHNNLGNLYALEDKFDLAMNEYRLSIAVAPEYFLTYNNLGNLYALRREFDKAIEEFKESIKLNPYYSESHNNLGLVYLEKENYKDAEREFEEALKLNPENAEAYNNLGNLYAKQGLFDQATAKYIKAIKLKPDFDKAHFNLGAAYFEVNLLDLAKQEWQRVLEINPNHQGALKNIKLLKDR